MDKFVFTLSLCNSQVCL